MLVLGDASGLREPESSLEVLHARNAEEAVEKLGRNRRIDAVLILSREAGAAVAAIREDILAPPPMFLAEGAPAIPGTRRLPSSDPVELLALLAEALE